MSYSRFDLARLYERMPLRRRDVSITGIVTSYARYLTENVAIKIVNMKLIDVETT